MSDPLVEAVKRHKMIAILRRVEPSCLEQTARALESGGIRMLEVPLTTAARKGSPKRCMPLKLCVPV